MFISFKDAKVKVVSVASTFERGYTDEYLRSLLEAKYVGKHLFNGGCLRLEGIDISSKEVILKVSKTDYYSLLATNLNNKDFLTDYDVIGNPTLSNNLAVSVLIRDAKDELLLVERSSKVAIGSSMLSVSVTGGLDYVLDVEANQGIIYTTVKNEVQEELGMDVASEELEVCGLFIGLNKLQPILVCNIKLNCSFARVNLKLNDEIERVHIVSKSDLSRYFSEFHMTEATRFHLRLFS